MEESRHTRHVPPCTVETTDAAAMGLTPPGGPRGQLMTTNEPDPDVSQAELAGVTPAASTARIARVRSQLTVAEEQAQQSSRIAPRHRRVRFVVPPRGWITPWTWTNRTRS